MFSGATVSLCFLPGSPQKVLPELVLSPVDFDAWRQLWRIRIVFKERIGLVHDVLECLRKANVDIVAAESASIDRQRHHLVSVVANTTNINGIGNWDESDIVTGRHLEQLRRQILARLMDQVVFDVFGRPRIVFDHANQLHGAADDYAATMQLFERSRGSEPVRDTGKVVGHGSKCFVRLPERIKTALVESLPPTASGRSKAKSRYLTVSDTTDRFLRTYFIAKEVSLVCANVVFADQVGAAAAITGAIHAAGLDIFTSLTRLYSHGDTAELEILVRGGNSRHDMTEDSIRLSLREALSSSELCEEFKVRLGYPKDYRSERTTELLKPQMRRKTGKTHDLGLGTRELLEQKRSSLDKGSSTSREAALKLSLVKDLLQEEKGAGVEGGPERSLVFMGDLHAARVRRTRTPEAGL